MITSSYRLSLMDMISTRSSLLWNTALVLGFACLTALFSQISFWIGPVPITGQTFAVLISGALLGSRRGALSQLTYLAIGATGLPFWFAFGGPIGIARIVGPTGGYLLGFVAAAFLVGMLSEKGCDRKVWKSVLAMTAGSIVIYIFGISWLAYFLPMEKILQIGVYPFLVGDCIKIAIAALALPVSWSLVKHFNH